MQAGRFDQMKRDLRTSKNHFIPDFRECNSLVIGIARVCPVSQLCENACMKIVKKNQVALIVFLLSFLCCGQLAAQHQHLLYLESGLEGGNCFLMQTGISYIHPGSLSVSLSHGVMYKTSAGAPADYQSDFLNVFSKPKDIIVYSALQAGKAIYGPNEGVRYNLRGGLALCQSTTLYNFTPNGSAFLGANYNYDKRTTNSVGIIMHPVIDLPLGRTAGFSTGVFVLVAGKINCWGIDGNFLIGKVRSRRGS